MKRLLMLALALCLSLPAYAANSVESAQEKISIYLGQLDAMCNQQAFLTYGFAQEPGKSWKAGLEELEAELKGNAELPRMLQGTPRLLIHLGLQTINAKKCLPKDDWDRKNVTDELGSYANPSPTTPENVTPRPAVWNESPMEIIERYNYITGRMEFPQLDLKKCHKGTAKLVENAICELTPYSSVMFTRELDGGENPTSITVVGEPAQSEEADYYILWSFLAMSLSILPDKDIDFDGTLDKLGLSTKHLPKMGSSTTITVKNKRLTMTRDKKRGLRLVAEPTT